MIHQACQEIDDIIVELFSNGKYIYIINDDFLKELRPDIIVAQGICEVCSPLTKEIMRAISILGYSPELIILNPSDISDILDNGQDIQKGWKCQRRTILRSLEYKINIIKRLQN